MWVVIGASIAINSNSSDSTARVSEIDLRAHYFAERLKRAERRRFRLVCGSVFDLEDRDFNLVLALYMWVSNSEFGR